VSNSKFINKALHYSTAQYELATLPGNRTGSDALAVRRRGQHSSEELLFRTLPIALRAKGIQPLAAWVRFFMETEP
jgi:hypothetical protein